MIDPKSEHIYNIILSLFIGILIALALNSLFPNPVIIQKD